MLVIGGKATQCSKAIDKEEVLCALRDVNLRYIDIAERFLPEDVVRDYNEIASSAICEVAKRLLSSEELSELSKQRRSRASRELISKDPEAHRRRSRKGARLRHLKGPKPDFRKMSEARGAIVWKPGERELLFDLAGNPEF